MNGFAVMARSHRGKEHVLRKYESRDDATAHALRVNMQNWDDVWIAEAVLPDIGPEIMPPMPWNILWQNGWAYLIDANGKKLASIYGSQKSREYVAEKLLETFGPKGNAE
jgi:hypothetical protein